MLTSDITNVYSDNIPVSSNMETTRNCLRRIARHDDTEFSNQSIMNVMEKFVKAVNDMDETILVPCRLMDLKVGDAGDTVVEMKASSKHAGSGNSGKRCKSTLNDMASTDLYNLYTMVNCVKNELLWGQNVAPEEEDERQKSLNGGIGSVTPTSASSGSVKGHLRRPSTVSMTSINSTASISDSDSDTGNENDSGIEAEENNGQGSDYSLQVAESFRRHLHGLHHSLQQITEAAVYLTTRYQNDVGGAV
ncbi:mid1-interacting protein 1-like isoform X1 [Zootermopsis nevadensis]|uniref:Mid1-interacting protein 1 n=1 Tax=Zootermopsis nevadensis TaxID=136037 RepID=A0A067RPA0_ZOONE|nr:mid1-interacting protein 1-like isoform X1 [Zootermopsis nevadensis]KDR21569.1 Mid1-interacting protein 1 [Zootermopsis nevadensis]